MIDRTLIEVITGTWIAARSLDLVVPLPNGPYVDARDVQSVTVATKDLPDAPYSTKQVWELVVIAFVNNQQIVSRLQFSGYDACLNEADQFINQVNSALAKL